MEADLYDFDRVVEQSQKDEGEDGLLTHNGQLDRQNNFDLDALWSWDRTWRHEKSTYEFSSCCWTSSIHQITHGLFLGNESASYDRRLFNEHNIRAVVVCGSYLQQPLKELARYFAMDISDIETQSVSQYFAAATDFIREALERGEGVFVHCAAGISRSPTFVIAYLIRFHGMTYGRAAEHVRSIRQVSRPNDGFVQQLQQYSLEHHGEV